MLERRMDPAFDLLLLPRSLLEKVYDLLLICDRAKLNLCLPRGLRVTKTTSTNEEKDLQFAALYLFFNRRDGFRVDSKGLSSQMCEFIKSNLSDPTVADILSRFPDLAFGFVKGADFDNLVRYIKGHVVLDFRLLLTSTLGCLSEGNEVWSEEVMNALEMHGTPDMYDAIMANPNLLQDALISNWRSFVFGIVCKRNAYGLLSHIIELSGDNALNARHYLSQTSTLLWFLGEPSKLKQVVDHVGVSTHVLHELMDASSSRLLMRSVQYLMNAIKTGKGRD